MKPEIKEKWLNALRSGEYSQGKHQLRDANDNFCCLGVLCDLYLKETDGEWEELVDDSTGYNYAIVSYNEDNYGPNSETLTAEVAKWSGLDNSSPVVEVKNGMHLSSSHLTVLNDEGYSFNEIADLIEKSL